MTELEEYYNKFKENKRLLSRHGQVEFLTSLKYIHECLEGKTQAKILDVGAGTGRYSLHLAAEGHDVTALELVEHNLDVLKSERTKLGLKTKVKVFQGNAMDLSRFQDETFDMTLVFGPMYHLFTFEDKLGVLREAKRVTKKNGYILVAYVMNEYSVITYAFKEQNIQQCMAQGKLTEDFHSKTQIEDLYDYVRLEDIDKLVAASGLTRQKIIAADGPANYIRSVLKEMDEESFELFMKYHFATCERYELLGASAHTVDILQKQ